VVIGLLGRFRVERAGEELSPPGRLVRTLLEVLLTRRGSFVPRDQLIDILWPGGPPSDPAGNLKVLVSRARALLGERSLILTGAAGYSFAESESCRVDAEMFMQRLNLGSRELECGRCREAASHLEKAIELWRGEPLAEEIYEDWAREYRDRLSGAYQEALESGCLAALANGDTAHAVRFARLAAAREPLREASHLLLARALAASGDVAAALNTVAGFRDRTVEELGLGLSPTAAELQMRLLNLDSAAAPARRAGDSGIPEQLPFVGRGEPLELLVGGFTGGRSGVVSVAGPAGSGKSRLLQEAMIRIARPVIAARAFPAEREDAWSVAAALMRSLLERFPDSAAAVRGKAAAALADVVPEIGNLRPIPESAANPEGRRALALQGALSLFQTAASKGALFVVDDLHWADPTSMALLGLVSRRVSDLSLVVAFRTANPSPPDSVLELLDQLDPPPLRIPVGGLPLTALSELVDDRLATLLHQATEGAPFAVEQLLRTLTQQGIIEREGDGIWVVSGGEARARAEEVIRHGQRQWLGERIRALPPNPRRVLGVLALLRREAPPRLVAGILDVPQAEVLQTLDRLWESGLARPGERGWEVNHDLIADAMPEVLGVSGRARLHALIAIGLESDSADPAELARHLSGAGDLVAAAECFARGSRQSLDRFANGEAESAANRGLDATPSGETLASLLEVRAEARFRRGALEEARRDLREAIRARPPGPQRSLTLTRLAMLTSGAQDYVHASELAELALLEAGDEPGARAEALLVAANFDLNRGRPESVIRREDEAMALFHRIGNSAGVARVLESRAFAQFLEGKFWEAERLLDRVARILEDAGEILRVANPRSGRGLVLAWMNRPEDGLADLDDALELSRLVGARELEAHVLWFRSQVVLTLGRLDEAKECAERTLALGREMGHRELIITGLIGLGSVLHAEGSPEEARSALASALDASSDMPIFISSAAVRLAPVLIDLGELEAADDLHRLVMNGPEMPKFECRLSMARLAFLRGDPGAEELAREALALALEAGHLLSARRLEQLLASSGEVSGAGSAELE
jgi:DNA-binding SARP family transcriptional activator/tetratricopeptide (TPR) repeat protein